MGWKPLTPGPCTYVCTAHGCRCGKEKTASSSYNAVVLAREKPSSMSTGTAAVTIQQINKCILALYLPFISFSKLQARLQHRTSLFCLVRIKNCLGHPANPAKHGNTKEWTEQFVFVSERVVEERSVCVKLRTAAWQPQPDLSAPKWM